MKSNHKMIIAGGTGFIGRSIAEYFAPTNDIIILTRALPKQKTNANGSYKPSKNVKLVHWDGKNQGEWCQHMDGASVVINLSGKSVNCRYNAQNKAAILNSRLETTKAIGEAIQHSKHPPTLWLNAASATIYRDAKDKPQDEYTGEIQNDFSVQVCKQWEAALFDQHTPATRKIALRLAITLGNGGVMTPYFKLLKWGLGGKQGSGKQMYSWIHINDVCRAIEWLWEHTEIEGSVNICSPNPITNATFIQTLRQLTNTKFGLPAPAWLLKIGAAIIGTETELLLKSRWVIPTKLLAAGFTFSYPEIDKAVQEIVNRRVK
jgi:uncharacterized protein (TIGR01777 family)